LNIPLFLSRKLHINSQFKLNHMPKFEMKYLRNLRYMVLILLLIPTENLCKAVGFGHLGPIEINPVDFPKPADLLSKTETTLFPLAGKKIARLTTRFKSPFNGKDLTGWCYRTRKGEETLFEKFDGKNESKDGRFTGRDGVLTVNPWDAAKGPHFATIWTTMDYKGDFSFTLEFRAGVNADSGIFLRGTQLQCRDYLVAGPYKSLKNYKPQDWNKIEVVVKDNIAHCTCNGELLEDALKIPVTGPIGLEADRGKMEYRNILIKALK